MTKCEIVSIPTCSACGESAEGTMAGTWSCENCEGTFGDGPAICKDGKHFCLECGEQLGY
jgi:hypothetical protein